jgi:hypothetical protein
MNNVLEYIEWLVKEYNYKPLPYEISNYSAFFYLDNIPSFLKKEGDNIPLYSLQGTKICNKYHRIVIGDYGAYIEIPKEDLIIENIHVPKEQTYRFEPKYFNHLKYMWYTTNDFSGCKIYYQIRRVSYANYRVGFFYISPYEVKVL